MSKLNFLVIGLLFAATTSFAQTAASRIAPVANPPQFIVIGSDDNPNAEAVRWKANVLNSGTNADGSKRLMSFYVNTDRWAWDSDLVEAILEAYKAGHSISNHTHTHLRCVGTSSNFGDFATRVSMEVIYADIMKAQQAMIDAGIPKKHQFGFRTPFLAYSDSTFTAMRKAGVLYDSSINSGMMPPGSHNWPYTLDIIPGVQEPDAIGNIAYDNCGSRNWWGRANPVREHQGLWVLPITLLEAHPDDRNRAYLDGPWVGGSESNLITGLDWNMWHQWRMDYGQTLRTLKHSLERSLAGNRAPFIFGTHSQMFFASGNNISAEERRRAFEEFVHFASQLDDVFFVTGDMVIRWMKNPVSAAEFKPENFFRE